MTSETDGNRVKTGVRNLDPLFRGGLPTGSVLVLGGAPGSGKTILTQQICFHVASPTNRVLYFNTLSEPTAKTLRYLHPFEFFDAAKLNEGGLEFIDLGAVLSTVGLAEASAIIMDHVKKVGPAVVVIDSFKVFDDIAESTEALRKFSYELGVSLMAWEVTTLLLGEYSPVDIASNPLFSIVDGLVHLTQREQSGENQRFIQIVKLRGTDHSRDEHSFVINAHGVEVFAPRVTIHREDRGPGADRCKTGIGKLDELLGEGIPLGSSLLVAGVAGTGKTVLLMEFLYRGAVRGERGIVFTFEETAERLRAAANGLGWDLDREIARGMLEIVFIPQPDILVEGHLLMMQERAEAMGARRIAIDSISVFLHKVKDPQVAREKVFQLCSIVQNIQAVGLFATDIPYGAGQLSRFGVEETVVDGVILLSSTEEGLSRQRYIEIYKLRNTAHLKGRHGMEIGAGGISIFPRYGTDASLVPPPPLDRAVRLRTGVDGLDALCGGGWTERSVTLVSGSAGIGKSTLGLQFLAAGAALGERGLYVTLEEGPTQLLDTAAGLGLDLASAVERGQVEFVYLSPDRVRPSQLVALLDDRIHANQCRRLVLDSVSHIVSGEAATDELRQLLYALVVRFKARGVTTLLTLESASMFSTDTVTERGYSPIADNIVMLRYERIRGEVHPTLTVVKTRGGPHDRGTWRFTIGTGGIRIGDRTPRPSDPG
ncbi:MAG: ATPase domain-containing protein [Myxococcota bacterium]